MFIPALAGIMQKSSRHDKISMVNTLEYFTGLRGFYVYSTKGKWKPHIGQKFFFKRKHNNNYDKITVAGKTLLKGQGQGCYCWVYS